MINNKDIKKLLLPGVIVGLILGFCLTMLVGVNQTDPIPNYIGGAACCLIPTILNCLIVLNGTAKLLDRKITLGDAFKRTVPFALFAIFVGLFTVIVLIEQVAGINTCNIPVVTTAIYEAILGVIVSTVSAYLALTTYVKQVKYTRRNK